MRGPNPPAATFATPTKMGATPSAMSLRSLSGTRRVLTKGERNASIDTYPLTRPLVHFFPLQCFWRSLLTGRGTERHINICRDSRDHKHSPVGSRPSLVLPTITPGVKTSDVGLGGRSSLSSFRCTIREALVSLPSSTQLDQANLLPDRDKNDSAHLWDRCPTLIGSQVAWRRYQRGFFEGSRIGKICATC